MSDIDGFKEKVEARLKALDNPQLSTAFAVRMALLAIPFLASQSEDKAFLWYWTEKEKYLLSTLRGIQIASFVVFNTNAAANAADAANTAYVAASAANTSVSAAAYTAANAADTATYAANAVDAAAYAAANAAANAAYAAANAKDAAAYVTILNKELELLNNNLKIKDYFTTRFCYSPELNKLRQTFFIRLRQLPRFDYWAEWLQARYEGKPLDLTLLEKTVLLPEEIQAQSPREINHYLTQLRDGELKQKMKRVRAIFIGDGEAGKTSLIQALNRETVIEGNTDMTPGIAISEWQVDDSELTAHFWDFGGQVIAHATHQFFLRSRCVYVLVLNSRSSGNNPNQQAEYWLEYVRAFGADAPVLIVGNKCDLTPVHLDIHRLKQTYPNVHGFFPVSTTGYQGKYADEFAIFKKAFSEQLRHTGGNQPYFSTKHFELTTKLRKLSRENPFLEKSVFEEMCKEKQIEEEELNSLIDLLDKLGEIIHFPEMDWLDAVLLNPRWLTYGVYPLLYDSRATKQNGRLTRDNVKAILDKHKVIDNEGNQLEYPVKLQHLLIQAMEKFKLCYPSADKPNDQWIVPDLLPTDQPADLQFEHRHALRFDFNFKTFLPRHVLNMFIVEHCQDIFTQFAWQHGVRLYSKTWLTHALVQANYQERVLSIEIYGTHSDKYFAALYDSVLKILNRMPKLKYEKLLYLDKKAQIKQGRVFSDELPVADYDDLLAHQADGIAEYRCKHGVYSVSQILRQVAPQEEKNMSTASHITIHSNNSVINLGDVTGDLTNTINQLPEEKQDLKQVLNHLQNLLQDSELQEEQKAEALGKLKQLTQTEGKSLTEIQNILNSVTGYLSGMAGFLSSGKEIKQALEQITQLFS
ncbi:COR domain-containing protein [Candidatus Albibeggiatoa sp. nov. NOAA]|uniref:COR domain-containing protein n=1 Tax=Candidatus Albibeggiatoa sp. nov. NOAA TaxID=3162724 RepID=UPI0032FAF6B6|nr:ADP-ribosylation factor-like protein [Thiotrichaceae bacterium]